MSYNDETQVLGDDSKFEKYSRSETEVLEDALAREESYDHFEKKYKEHFNDEIFVGELRQVLINKNVEVSKLIRESGISKSYLYQILNGERSPSRDAIINIAIVLKCDLDEINRFLKISEKQRLYAKNKRDSVIIYAITHHYSLKETNDLLKEQEEQLL